MRTKSQKDFWAGVIFMAFGLSFLIMAQKYEMGTAIEMGPAYFPSVTGALLAIIGLVIFVQSFVIQGDRVPRMFFRPIFLVTLSLVLFASLLNQIGLVFAMAFLVAVSAFAGYEFKVKEVLVLYVLITVFSVFVFAKGFGLPFQLWPSFIAR